MTRVMERKWFRFTSSFGSAVIAASVIVILSGFSPTAASEVQRGGGSSDTVATVADRPITLAEVDNSVAGQLFKLQTDEYNIRRTALQAIIEKRLLESAAATKGMTVGEYEKQVIENAIDRVSEDQVRLVYQGSRDQFGVLPEDLALQRIRSNLFSQRLNERRKDLIQHLKRDAGVRVSLEPPRLIMSPGNAPGAGSANAKVTIIEFSDFECPFCSRAALTVRKLLNQYPNELRLYYRHLPLAIHANAINAAKAGFCAAKQGRFWPMHDLLFSNQKNLSPADLIEYGRIVKIDLRAFETCLASSETDAAIKLDHDAAIAYGVAGTPAFFVNGRLLAGNVSLDAFVDVINEELQRVDSNSNTSAATGRSNGY